MPKVSFEKVINVERDKLYKIATDYERFQTLMPQYFPSIRIRSSRDNVTVIEEHLRIAGKELIMMTKHVATPPTTHEIFVIGGDAKGSHIVETYEQVSNGTKVTISADIKLKGVLKIAGFLGKNKIQNGLERIMDEFAKIAEV